MRNLSPARLLAIYAGSAAALATIALIFPGRAGVAALTSVSFFMSIMFPTIFALGLRGFDSEARKTAASFLIMAIIGGAVLTLLMGAISDVAGIHRSMMVPLACFMVVLAFAAHSRSSHSAV